jgi:hypothetical protein
LVIHVIWSFLIDCAFASGRTPQVRLVSLDNLGPPQQQPAGLYGDGA